MELKNLIRKDFQNIAFQFEAAFIRNIYIYMYKNIVLSSSNQREAILSHRMFDYVIMFYQIELFTS